MQRWKCNFIEVYTGDGYQGRWESEPSESSRGFGPQDIPRLARMIRNKLGFKDAILQYCDDGDTLVIGVFVGVEPPARPKQGRTIVPDAFEDDL